LHSSFLHHLNTILKFHFIHFSYSFFTKHILHILSIYVTHTHTHTHTANLQRQLLFSLISNNSASFILFGKS
jgi:hypothetical protein